MKLFKVIALSITLLLFSCDKETNTTSTTSESFTMEPKEIKLNDAHSQASYQAATLTHLQWDATVNFETKTIDATADWTIEHLTEASQLILDTKDLTIHKVLLNSNKETNFSMGATDEFLGTPLIIDITPETKHVSISYTTSPTAEAIQWLSPQQTADKTSPFLFTQSQAILARTWLPCMDGPGVRFTYAADVKVPEGLLALMSAENPKKKSANGQYSFKMNQPIPSYLMALAVGDVSYQSLGNNAGVYAEPSMIKTSADEFEDLPEMITAAEELYGPYRWDEYDIIVLPPSFPFGGMENPRLTFATPTILAGDKSLTSLVAHELAHSWSGNLVTNSNWNDFWLNEGFTVYFEQRIMESLYGKEYSEMLASLSFEGLQHEIHELNETDTHLKLDLKGRNPDDGMTAIAYDKGYLFLRQIEETIGRDRFDAFIKQYFTTYGFKVMDTESFVELLNDELIGDDKDLAKNISINDWIYGPGLPAIHPKPTSNKFAKVLTVSEGLDLEKIKTASEDWSSHEWQHFIENLPRDIGVDKMKAIDAVFDLTHSGNSEIQFDWYQLAILNQYKPAYSSIENFLINVGRRKFLTPLYSDMVNTQQKDWAKEIYNKARPNYHSVSYNTIDGILK